MSHVSPWADLSYDSNNISMEKDLKISYLQHPELSQYHDFNREQSKNTLKQITDKYGFYWDEKGRLIKARPMFHANQSIKLKKQEKTKPLLQRSLSRNQIKLSKQKHKQNTPSLTPSLAHLTTKQQQQECQNLKTQISTINNRINAIVNKYKPQQQQQQQQHRQQQPMRQKLLQTQCTNIVANSNVQMFSKVSHSSGHQCFCQCKDLGKEKVRLVTEEDTMNSPYFGAQQQQHRTQNYVTRSKSTNLLARAPKNLKNDGDDDSRVSLIEKKMDKQIERFRERRKAEDSEQNILEKEQQSELNGKINLITLKIKQFQKQKQKLNLDFKKFQFKQLSKTPQKQKVVRSKNENPVREISKSIEKVQMRRNKSKLKIMQLPTVVVDKSVVTIKSNNVEKNEEKCTLPVKETRKSIIEKLCRQIQLDQEFRNAKLWFENNDDPHKWGIVADKLVLEGIVLKYHELVEKFSCSSEEHNPFFSIKQSHENYASLLSAYKEDERHWKEQIQCQFSNQDLVQEQFSNKQLDIQEKGCIRAQDIVRYINMRTKNFYRTRDLLLVFQRFAGKQKKQVHFSKILQVLLS